MPLMQNGQNYIFIPNKSIFIFDKFKLFRKTLWISQHN